MFLELILIPIKIFHLVSPKSISISLHFILYLYLYNIFLRN
uniref:Uncharacterized protein n=1 Tax=Musa acuminata subsp. malaccensis TaxID=214687 RepID=A0A804IUL0_MUSAM